MRPWRAGCFFALALGFITVAAFFGVSAIVIGPRGAKFISEEWPFLILQALLAGAPFAILALIGIRSKLPWLVALFLTLCVWGLLFYSVILAARDGTGANIGMGWLMLVAPIIISAAAVAATSLNRNRA